MSTPTITYPPLVPCLCVQDASSAIAFYTAAFGAKELYNLKDSKSGKIVHAELLINNSHVMLADENPAYGNKSPSTLLGTPVKFCLMVESADAAVEKACSAGATLTRPPSDEFYGYRCGCLRDPFGYEWLVQHKIEDVSPGEMQVRMDAMLADC